MFRKYNDGVFGTCPRALCDGAKCLPVGMSDKLRGSRVKMFCPKCDEVYMVQKAKQGGGVQTATNLDGSYFGQSFPQIFITTFENMMEQPPRVYLYEPKIWGFRIAGSRGSKYYDPAKSSLFRSSFSNQTCFSKQTKEKDCTNPNCKSSQCKKIKQSPSEKAVSPPQTNQPAT